MISPTVPFILIRSYTITLNSLAVENISVFWSWKITYPINLVLQKSIINHLSFNSYLLMIGVRCVLFILVLRMLKWSVIFELLSVYSSLLEWLMICWSYILCFLFITCHFTHKIGPGWNIFLGIFFTQGCQSIMI